MTERFRRSIQLGEPWEDTFPLSGRDGQYRWFLSRALPIRDDQGRVVRWFGTNTDITDSREAQAALSRLNAELEARVEARTAEIVQLQKIKSPGQLTGGVAHDFNNPRTCPSSWRAATPSCKGPRKLASRGSPSRFARTRWWTPSRAC